MDSVLCRRFEIKLQLQSQNLQSEILNYFINCDKRVYTPCAPSNNSVTFYNYYIVCLT